MTRDNNLDVRIQFHSPDGDYAAVFLRDGAEWFLEGALVGIGPTRHAAVADLIELAKNIVIEGHNFLTQDIVSSEDRTWIFDKLDWGDSDDEMYRAIRDLGVQR